MSNQKKIKDERRKTICFPRLANLFFFFILFFKTINSNQEGSVVDIKIYIEDSKRPCEMLVCGVYYWMATQHVMLLYLPYFFVINPNHGINNTLNFSENKLKYYNKPANYH